MSKRRIEESQSCKKKNIDEVTQQLYSSSNDWPVYNHPDGGIIKITPWGSIRQFELNGEMVTKFEDMSFTDYNFTPAIRNNASYNDSADTPLSNASSHSNLNNNQDSHHRNGSDGSNEQQELPQTPQSIQSIRLSPCDEAENYIMKGYENVHHQTSNNGSGNEFQFAQEPEHYFGMMDDEFNDNDMVM